MISLWTHTARAQQNRSPNYLEPNLSQCCQRRRERWWAKLLNSHLLVLVVTFHMQTKQVGFQVWLTQAHLLKHIHPHAIKHIWRAVFQNSFHISRDSTLQLLRRLLCSASPWRRRSPSQAKTKHRQICCLRLLLSPDLNNWRIKKRTRRQGKDTRSRRESALALLDQIILRGSRPSCHSWRRRKNRSSRRIRSRENLMPSLWHTRIGRRLGRTRYSRRLFWTIFSENATATVACVQNWKSLQSAPSTTGTSRPPSPNLWPTQSSKSTTPATKTQLIQSILQSQSWWDQLTQSSKGERPRTDW